MNKKTSKSTNGQQALIFIVNIVQKVFLGRYIDDQGTTYLWTR